MSGLPLEIAEMLGQTMTQVVPVTILLALTFSVLSHFWVCNPGTPWWRKRELATDISYWFLVPLFARVFRIALLVLAAACFFQISDADELIAFYNEGHGPLSVAPLWVQAVLFLVLADFMMYWLHRMFHGGGFWKYHAIHHSSEDVDWISAARFHPVNLLLGTIGVDVVLLLAGISPTVMLWLGPLNIFHSAFVHANLNWDLGQFKYVIATPMFHRWHHTALEDGGNTNFAGSGRSGCRKTGCPTTMASTISRRSRPGSRDNWPIRSGNKCSRPVVSRSRGLSRAFRCISLTLP
jgi:sterol desaturase/sphingolipid hydroxylase (fatty acid hydroxylase superfamily)